jgi:Double zinc ribbon
MRRGVPALRQVGMVADPKAREFDRGMRSLASTPQILCWSCRELTPFEVDRCQHCGSPFAGSTGGAYRGTRSSGEALTSFRKAPSSSRRRSLSEIVEDLRRIRELSGSLSRTPRPPRRERGTRYQYTYQCPSCDRYVTAQATSCVCGVRFAQTTATSSVECPECGANIPSGRTVCPVCLVRFLASSRADLFVYSCPRCGARVSADARRCKCGVRFED